ncbi:glycosyltransferase family 1 protein [Patescibacteria group bacterium]|nr:MAG: glycosyltransferase family 1 protein [Patescibacteria group bacterium]
MKRLLAITDEYPPVRGGVANYLAGVLEAFCTYASVELLVPADLAPQVVAPFPVHTGTFAHRLLWPRWIPLVPRIVRIVTERSVDAVLVSHVLPYGTAAWMAARITRRPYIVCVHGLDLARAEAQSRKKGLTQRVLRGAALIVANSEYTLARAMALAPGVSGVVVPPCPAIDPTPAATVPEPSERFILAVGRMVPRKGFRTLLRATKEALREAPEVRVVMVGDGPERAEVVDDRKRLGLEGAVQVRTATDDELRTLYAQCAFFVLPTQSSDLDPEGFGTVFLEANGFGKTVVAGAGGGVAEAVLDGKTGLLVDGRDPNDIAQAMLRLWRDPAEAMRLGETGRRRVQERFRYIHAIQPLVDAWNALWRV